MPAQKQPRTSKASTLTSRSSSQSVPMQAANQESLEPSAKKIVHIGQQTHVNKVVFQGLSFVEFGIYAYGVLLMIFAFTFGDPWLAKLAVIMCAAALLGVIAQHSMFYTANLARGWHIILSWVHKLAFFGNLIIGLLILLRVLAIY